MIITENIFMRNSAKQKKQRNNKSRMPRLNWLGYYHFLFSIFFLARICEKKWQYSSKVKGYMWCWWWWEYSSSSFQILTFEKKIKNNQFNCNFQPCLFVCFSRSTFQIQFKELKKSIMRIYVCKELVTCKLKNRPIYSALINKIIVGKHVSKQTNKKKCNGQYHLNLLESSEKKFCCQMLRCPCFHIHTKKSKESIFPIYFFEVFVYKWTNFSLSKHFQKNKFRFFTTTKRLFSIFVC